MYTRTNARNKTNFVGHNTTGVEIYLSTPLAKAKKASRLTLRSGKTRVDLDVDFEFEFKAKDYALDRFEKEFEK